MKTTKLDDILDESILKKVIEEDFSGSQNSLSDSQTLKIN